MRKWRVRFLLAPEPNFWPTIVREEPYELFLRRMRKGENPNEKDLVERIAPPRDPNEEFEEFDWDDLELNLVSSYSEWYLDSDGFLFEWPLIRCSNPYLTPAEQEFDHRIYLYIDWMCKQYALQTDVYFFSIEIDLERQFDFEGLGVLNFCCDQLLCEFLGVGLEFLGTSISSARGGHRSRVAVLGVARGDAFVEGWASSLVSLFSALSVFCDFSVTSVGVSQDPEFFKRFFYFSVRYHQHSYSRYDFFPSDSFNFPSFFTEGIKTWSDAYYLPVPPQKEEPVRRYGYGFWGYY